MEQAVLPVVSQSIMTYLTCCYEANSCNQFIKLNGLCID